jgi:uncharacterized membrane protein YhiD involved in acid resistance
MNDAAGILRALGTENIGSFSFKMIPSFLFSFFVCAILAYTLGKIYVRYGTALSNRISFSRNFVILSVTTMFIITVVKSSLALSLGLVGALSIVRFRTAIKEPEELMFLFISIAIGLGCGAGLAVLTILSFIGFFIVILVLYRLKEKPFNQSLYITITDQGENRVTLEQLVNVISTNCVSLKLKRTDENIKSIQASFIVEFADFDQLKKTQDELRNINTSLLVSVLDNSRDF